MVPTAAFTSMLDEPSSGSNSTAYLPTGVLGRDRDDVLVFLRPHHADPAGVVEALLDGLVGEHVELLLLLALDVPAPARAEDVDQPGAADRRRDDLGGQRDVVEQVGQLARRLGVAVSCSRMKRSMVVTDVCTKPPGMMMVRVARLSGRRSSGRPRRCAPSSRVPSVDDGDRALRSVRRTATPCAASRASVSGAGCP